MEQPIVTFLTFVAIGICTAALFIVLETLFPVRLERIRLAAEKRTGAAILIGLVNLLFFGSILVGFLSLGQNVTPIFMVPAIFLASILGIGITLGVAAFARLTGDRLVGERPVIQRTMIGTGAIYLACLVPVVGWFGMTVFAAALGLGALILSFTRQAASSSLKEVEHV